FFERVETAVQVRALVRRAIAGFRAHNLATDAYPLPRNGAWDAIFCRNVLIYFDLPTTRRVLEQMAQALRPGGLLFLGYSESLFRIYDGFELVEHEGSFFYRKPLEPKVRPAPAPPPAPIVREPPPPPVAPVPKAPPPAPP